MQVSSNRQPRKAEPPIVAGRVPPHDLDCEAAVLEACFRNESQREEVLMMLLPEHFYSDANGRIFEAIVDLSRGKTEVTTITVAGWLRDRDLRQVAPWRSRLRAAECPGL